MDQHYFSHVRREIAPLLPDHMQRVLEVGCGEGATLAWLKQQNRAQQVVGVEYSEAAAAVARQHLDQVWQGDVEKLPLETLGQFDVVLCLDVLEHLVDPWQTLQRLRGLLRPGGCIIVSVPNVQHYSVVLPLLLHGRWPYQAAGILDRTHLRFFTRSSAEQLLQSAGLTLSGTCHAGAEWAPSRFWRWLGKFRAAAPWTSVQYIMRGDLAL